MNHTFTLNRSDQVSRTSGTSLARCGLISFIVWGCASVACANIWPIEDTWAAVGTTTLSDITGSSDGGDGAGETMLLVNGTSTVGPMGVTYDFRGVMHNGESVTVDIALVNPKPSYCRLVVDFYNRTDSRVIASTSEIHLLANSTQSVQLSMTAASDDSNDQLQLRFIRSDDGATYRDFAIDSVLMEDWYFPRTSSNSRTPDLPLLPHDAALQADMDSIINGWYATKLPPPTATKISNAEGKYNALNIVNSGGVLTGDITDFSQSTFIGTLGAALLTDPTNTTWIEMVNNTVKLVAQNHLRGDIPFNYRGYDTRYFIRKAVLLKDFLDQDAIDSLNYVLHRNTKGFDRYWQADYPGPITQNTINTDQVYNYSDSLLMYAIGFQKTPEEAQRWARAFKRYCDRFATYSRSTSDGIKEDGCGFHHWANYENYMYAYKTFVDVLDLLDTTQLQVEVEHYYNFRDALIAQFVRSREQVKPISLSGRSPLNVLVNVNEVDLKQMALAGGRILGLATADPEVAAVRNSIYGIDPELGVSDVNPLEGAFQFNYAHMGVYRKNGWTAAMRGFSSYMWGTEAYTTDNRYGRYQSYGGLQVIYTGGAEANGIILDGWDWNYAPGTTSIVLPFDLLHAYRARIDELQEEEFAGFGTLKNKGSDLLSKTHGEYGVFGMMFHERENQGFSTVYGPNTHNDSFVFRKSYFAFDDIIIALGSNISNDDSTHHTATTLYQREADDTQPIVVNGVNYTAQDTNTFTTGSSRWALDRLQTGYYLPTSNGDLVLSRGSQTTPPENENDPSNTNSYKTGVFAKLYIDHGTAPADDDYEYVVVPSATAQQMIDFEAAMAGPAALRPYQVMAKDVNHHVVKYQGSGKEVWGLALFDDVSTLPAECVVKSNAGASLVMYERHGPSELTLSVTDPNLRMVSRSFTPAQPSTVVLTLRGYWIQNTTNTNVVTEQQGNNQTVVTFQLADGLPAEIQLVENRFATWLDGHFTPTQLGNPAVSGMAADPDVDRITNLYEFILNKDPWVYDTGGGVQIGYTGPEIEMSFTLTDNLAGYALHVEESPNLEEWTPVIQISDGINELFAILDNDYTYEEFSGPRSIKVRTDQLGDAGFLRLSVDPL